MTEKIKIEDLIVTQNILRNFDQIDDMVDHVSIDGLWTSEVLRDFNSWATRFPTKSQNNTEHLIAISEFPDGLKYIRDGHHRCVATLLGGRSYLLDDEYVLTKRTYEDYMDINLDVGWVTPFDPKTEVRLSEFMDFKKLVMYMTSDHTEDEIIEYIKQNKSKYMCHRTMMTVSDLISLYHYFMKTRIKNLKRRKK